MTGTHHNPEITPQPPTGIQDFNRIILPFVHTQERTDLAIDLITKLPPDDRAIYQTLREKFTPEGTFHNLIKVGDFPSLLEYADEVASDIGEKSELTLPRMFAVHALTSIQASVMRPFKEESAHRDDRTTYFLTQFAGKLALQMPESHLSAEAVDPYDFYKATTARSARLAASFKERPTWLDSKLAMLTDRILLRRHHEKMVDREPRIEVGDLRELRRNNDRLFYDLQRLKRFSIKSAVHTGVNSSWSIHDVFNVRMQHATLADGKGSGIQPDRWRPTMVMHAFEHTFAELSTPEVKGVGEQRPNYEDFLRYTFMDENGQLYGDMFGVMPLRSFYEKAGKTANYESLRQFLIQKYFDLTVPVEIVREVEKNTSHMLGERSPDEAREHGMVYHDLLLPRILILRQYTPDSLDALERQEKGSSGIRQRHHHRAAQPRRLPAGYKASALARALAEELGITLADNETLVRPHERGDKSLGSIAHRAKERSIPDDKSLDDDESK